MSKEQELHQVEQSKFCPVLSISILLAVVFGLENNLVWLLAILFSRNAAEKGAL